MDSPWVGATVDNLAQKFRTANGLGKVMPAYPEVGLRIRAWSGRAVEKSDLFPALVNEAPGLNVKHHRKLLSSTSHLGCDR